MRILRKKVSVDLDTGYTNEFKERVTYFNLKLLKS